MPDSPWVKVCGVTRPEDGALAATLGAGFVGINFWPRSPRHLADLERARAVAEAMDDAYDHEDRADASPAVRAPLPLPSRHRA